MLRNSRLFVLALLLAAACGNDAVTEPTPAPDLMLVVLSGGAQTGMTGHALEQPLLVQATRNGQAFAGAGIRWSTSDGSITGDGETNHQGFATATWTMPVKAGTMHAIAVMDDSTVKPAQFAATSRFPDLAIVNGDGQTDTVGHPLADTLTVKVSWLGQPLAGLGVRWSSSGITNVVTDSNGLASSTYQLGTVSTIYHVSASLEGTGAPSVNFSEIALPGPPALFQWVLSAPTLLVSGRPWTFGTQLMDEYGNPLDGAPVAWSLAGGDGDIIPNLAFADSAGLTWATVTFGHSVQPFVLTASAGDGLQVQDTLDLPDFVLYEAYGGNGVAPPPPSTAEVHVGDVVRWRAFGSLVHAFAPLGHPELAEPMTGNPPAFAHRFDEPGTFVWYCPLHENDTTGTYGIEHFTIVVNP